MNHKVKELLENRVENHIFPFFWQHGESEQVLREYMRVIHEANISAVCIESRPHPDFAGPGWWHDMDIILDEAKKRQMKVWILDDSHFPTGYCNGLIEKKPLSYRRQFLTYQVIGELSEGAHQTWSKEDYQTVSPFKASSVEEYFHMSFEEFADDQWLGAVAVKKNGSGADDLLILHENKGTLEFTAPEGEWKVYSCQLTRNRGPHRSYMNMLDQRSCHTLIEAVYEPHFQHYHEEFGKTIAGFFSDEPEIGNGHLYMMDQKIYDNEDQPWSEDLKHRLRKEWGSEFVRYLPLLWEREFDEETTAKIRYEFMNQVTRCVEENFSMQIGEWCRDHGVQYIGHLIEDNNQHARCGSSLGHYFRGLAGQDMAGIDDIGGQVLPQGEDMEYISHLGTKRDGVFYHFTLGRLASSAAAIDSRKKGRSFCEIFGNYGWEEGVRLEAFLADHFMVRGINHFVPHAFSAKAFPDPDCPPHFYAHGHNPQYRHFGVLMRYMNRVCSLISGGVHESEAAVLYHGDAEWTGMKCMYIQDPARILTESQIGFDFVPSDIFTDACYKLDTAEGLKVNTQKYNILIIPEADYIAKETAQAVVELSKKGFPCIFLNGCPKGICSKECPEEASLLRDIRNYTKVVKPGELAGYMKESGFCKVEISPAEPYIRSYLYHNATDILYMTNEGKSTYAGEVKVRTEYSTCYCYNAWDNVLEEVDAKKTKQGMLIQVKIEPGKSLIVVFDVDGQEIPVRKKTAIYQESQELKHWKRSACSSIQYPEFGETKEVSLPDHLEKELPDFAGIVRYESWVDFDEPSNCMLRITDAGEAVQVFINDRDMGIQIVPPFDYDISKALVKGRNKIVIEVATTLERQVFPKNRSKDWKPDNVCGLCGTVHIIAYRKLRSRFR